ncbi:MAG: DUF1800 domain-containing protein [Candidatus Kapabacteria bacterium]|nr:DUF1800 domain-containing protein [Candidatus Kapabacteria bacterium]
MAKLKTYSGPWTRREAAHLLRRASFGATNDQLNKAVTDGLDKTLTALFTPLPKPTPPTNTLDGSKWVPDENQVWTKTVVISNPLDASTSTAYDLQKGDGFYNATTKTWWVKQMIHSPVSIHEKLTLFWSNHFSTQMNTVQNGIFSFNLLAYLRANAFGNFRDMARRVTLDAAMLRFLNGNTNTKGSANENYGRELQELFTIGKGPEVSQGDYTNYTEQDVRAAAKVLTGWREFGQRDLILTTGDKDLRDNEPKAPPMFADNPNTVFIANNHDTSDKTFSPRYQNKVIKGRTGINGGLDELNELLDMIFGQDATALYIVGKLYRWFVNSEITEEIQRDIIVPLATELRQSGFVVGPVLRKLLASDHFFDASLRGAQLRSPADLVFGLLRTATTWTPPSDPTQNTRFYQGFAASLAALQMDLVEPASVAGWEAYYQSPDYYRMWLSTATLPIRDGFGDAMLTNNNSLGKKPIIDTPMFVKGLIGVEDSLKLIDVLNEIFFAVPFSEETRMKLAEDVLMNGGRYYEWTDLWNSYANNPTNTAALKAVKTNLDPAYAVKRTAPAGI